MQIVPLPRFGRALVICFLLATGILIVGCDSGGSSSSSSSGDPNGGGNTLENAKSITVDLKSSSSGSSTNSSGERAEAKASGTLTVRFHYENDSGSDCTLSTTKTIQDSDLPYNESFDPTNISGDCSSPADFDGVQVKFASGSGFSTSGLVLSLLDGGGTEITSDEDPSDGLGLSETVSDEVDLPDEVGGDGGTTAPGAPSELSVSTGEGIVDLSWAPVTAIDLEGFNIYRSTSSISDVSGRNPLNGSLYLGTSYTDGEVNNGTTYHYVVTAVDESGNESAPSNEVTATPSRDTGGGDDGGSTPAWVGNWKESGAGKVQLAFSFTEGSLTTANRESSNPTVCEVGTSQITNISPNNVVTFEGGSQLKLEVLNGGSELKVTAQDGTGDSFTLKPADESKNPSEIIGCEVVNETTSKVSSL